MLRLLDYCAGQFLAAITIMRLPGMLALTVLLELGITAGSSVSCAGALAPGAVVAVPAWLQGVWSRDWIQKGEVKTNTVDVHYLQTPTYFADMRIPRDRPHLTGAKSFADLTDQQLRLLARQNGFVGLTVVSGNTATWNHDIQYQPSDGAVDQGRLQPVDATHMREHGLDASYIESWRFAGGHGHFLVIRVARAGRLLQTLVVVGNRFLYVRNRATELPAADSFDALIDSTKATRAQIEQYLDCEFSVGRVRGGYVAWKIEQSTLPWREGRHLDFAAEIAPTKTGAELAARAADDNEWTVPVNTFTVREVREMFGKANK